jgi:hypothetical protein
MAKKLGLVVIGLLMVATLILAGCGGGGTKTTQAGDTNVAASQEVNPFDDIPIYTGAKTVTGDFSSFTSATSGRIAGMKSEWHFYEIKTSDTDAIQNFYKSAMPDKSWISLNTNVPSVGGMTYSMYMKGTTYGIIMTFPDPNNSGSVILAICRTHM